MADSQSKSILNITNLATVAVLIGLIIFVVKIASVFGIFLFSFIIAFLLFPMVEWLNKRRVPRVLAILIVYVVIGAVLVGIAAALVPAIIDQANSLFEQLPKQWEEQMAPRLAALQAYLQSRGVSSEHIRNYMSNAIPTMQQWGITIGQKIVTGVQGAVGGIVSLLSVPIIVFYLLLDARRIRENLMSLAPKRTANEIQNLLNKLAEMLNHYIRGQLMLSFIMFAITTIALSILGVHHALLLGVLAGLVEVIPIVGPTISLVAALLVCYFLPSTSGLLSLVAIAWLRPLIVFAFYMVIQWAEGNILVPRIMGGTLNLHPLTVMFSLLAGGYLAGIFGMLLALPIAASLKVVFEMYYPAFIQQVEDLVSRKPRESPR